MAGAASYVSYLCRLTFPRVCVREREREIAYNGRVVASSHAVGATTNAYRRKKNTASRGAHICTRDRRLLNLRICARESLSHVSYDGHLRS